MKKILFFLSLIMFISCTETNERKKIYELTNQRISLEHSLDSINKIRLAYIYEVDSLKALQNYILSNQESRERNDLLINERKSLERDITNAKNINNSLTIQNNNLKNEVNSNKFALASSKNIYIVKIKIHQTTYTLDLGEYVKNKINDIDFEIPVDKSYYDNCKIGQKVTDPGLKIGSLIMDGDFSKLKVTIIGKRIIKRQ